MTDYILTRKRSGLYGIFSELRSSSGTLMAYCLTHAYSDGKGGFVPKVPPGVYTCVRGVHQLENGVKFETFEITGVPDFQGNKVTRILFHKGNVNNDSKGCELMGTEQSQTAVLESRTAFELFMSLQEGKNTLTLEII